MKVPALALLGTLALQGSLSLRPEKKLNLRYSPEELISVAPRGSLSPDCEPFPGKRVVLATVNVDFFDMFVNWLIFAEPFLQDTEHLQVVAEDAATVALLEKLRGERQVDFTVVPPRPAASSLISLPFNSSGYGKVVWDRPFRILELVQRGCSVLYADIDSVWRRDPFIDIGAAGSGELYLTDDHGDAAHVGGRKWDFCTCFLYMHPTDSIQSLIEDWGAHATGNFNQYVFNWRLGVSHPRPQMQVLPWALYPPGQESSENPDSIRHASVIHANYMKGHETKMKWFQERDLWRLPRTET